MSIKQYVSLLLIAVLLFTAAVSCNKPGLPEESSLETVQTTAPPPPLSGGETKPPRDSENQKTYEPSSGLDPTLALERQDRVLSRLDNKTPYKELITKTMDVNAFLDKCYDVRTVGGMMPNPQTLSAIDEDYGVECLRRNKSGNYYSVHKLKQGGLLYIFYRLNTYQSNGFYDVFGWFVTQKKLSYKDFSTISKGSPYEDVEAVDPAADIYEQKLLSYLEKTSKQTSIFFVTRHYLTDGIITMNYEFVNGKHVVYYIEYHSNFQVDLLFASSYPSYNGRILDIDAIQ